MSVLPFSGSLPSETSGNVAYHGGYSDEQRLAFIAKELELSGSAIVDRKEITVRLCRATRLTVISVT